MLPRSQRLVQAADHRQVARRGRRGRSGSLTVTFAQAPAGRDDGAARDGAAMSGALLAVVVPKSVGSAPVRNRLRRRLQNLAAARVGTLPAGSRVVVRPEPAAARLSSVTLADSLDRALHGATSRPGRAS